MSASCQKATSRKWSILYRLGRLADAHLLTYELFRPFNIQARGGQTYWEDRSRFAGAISIRILPVRAMVAARGLNLPDNGKKTQ